MKPNLVIFRFENVRANRFYIEIARPALISCIIAVSVEVITCASLSTRGMQAFAYYLSDSEAVAEITQTMWKVQTILTQLLILNRLLFVTLTNITSPPLQTIDWTYIFYALDYQLAAILLATSPRWYLYQALGSNLLWMLPWAIVVTKLSFPESTAWTYYAIIFGGALVFDFFATTLTLWGWAWKLMTGRLKTDLVQKGF